MEIKIFMDEQMLDKLTQYVIKYETTLEKLIDALIETGVAILDKD